MDIPLDAGRGYPHAPLLGLREDLRVGAVSGPAELEFDQITNIAVDAGDRIYVAVTGMGQVRVFEQNGAFLWSFGRQGEGPGEFQFITNLFFQGDTVAVVDAQAGRLTRLTPGGRLIETVSYLSPEMRFTPASAARHGLFVNVIRSARSSNRPVGTLLADSMIVYWIPANWLTTARFRRAPADRVAVPVLRHVFGHRYVVSPGFSMPPLWDLAGHAAFDGSGRVYVHNGAEYEIEVYDEDGRLLRRLTGSHTPIPITPDMVEDVRRWIEESVEAGSESVRMFRASALRMTGLPTGHRVPVMGRMLVSRAGTIWVERLDLLDLAEYPAHSALRLSSQRSRWDVISPTGMLLGTVELPSAFLALAATDQSLVGVWRDSLGVEYVRRLVLEAPE